MNAKYALALILALQVSMSMCEIAAPSQELVDKYNSLKSVFYKRLLNAYGKLQEAASPFVERASQAEGGRSAVKFAEDLQSKPEFQAFVKVASGIGEEAGPLVDKARASALGVYEEHVRPYIGTYLNDIIDHIKVYLDVILPAE